MNLDNLLLYVKLLKFRIKIVNKIEINLFIKSLGSLGAPDYLFIYLLKKLNLNLFFNFNLLNLKYCYCRKFLSTLLIIKNIIIYENFIK
jgi:hypothetical protein